MNIKKLGIIVMILFFIVVTSVPVLAITDYQVIVSTDKTEVTPADTVKVTVSLKDIQPETGLGAFVGRLTYDTEVFETVTQEDVVGATGWGTVLYNPDGGYLAVERAAGDGVKTDNDVLVITLKVKADATIKNAQVIISEISCSTGEEDLTAVDAGISIAIKEKTTGDNSNTNTNNNTNNNGVNNNNTNNNTPVNNNVFDNNANNNSANVNNTNGTGSNNNKVNNTNNNGTNKIQNNVIGNTANSNLPYAGVNDYIMPAIMIALVVAAISYIRYQKIKNI